MQRTDQPQARPTPTQPEPERAPLPQPLLDLIEKISTALRQ